MTTLKIKREHTYEDGTVLALVENFGREYSVTVDERGHTIFRTNPNQYARLQKWKIDADIKAIKARFPAAA